MIKKPVKHHDNSSGPGDQQIAKDLVDVVFDLDKIVDCPRFMVGSRQLCQVPFAPPSSNSEVIPLGSRMEELESTVDKLVKSFEGFKNNFPTQSTSFASVVGNDSRAGLGQQGHGQSAGQHGAGGPPYGGARSRVDSLSSGVNVGRRVFQNQRSERERLMSLSEKERLKQMRRLKVMLIRMVKNLFSFLPGGTDK